MLTHIRTEADLDAALDGARRNRSAVCRADCRSGAAAVAAAARRLCRPCRNRGVAAAFDRQRRRDLGPARRGIRSVRAGSHLAGARRPGWRGSACRRRKSERSRKSPAPSTSGKLALASLADIAAEEAHAALTAVHGIGPWTADIYLLSCLGHADAWPAGDLALQEAARLAFGLRARPTAKEMIAARRAVAAVARRGGARAVDLLSRRQRPRRRAVVPRSCQSQSRANRVEENRVQENRADERCEWPLNSTVRGLIPRSGAARQLVVFLHGYGADGNDLIEIGRAWQQLLPHAAFVSPHAPEPCGQAPVGRQWFPLTFRDPNERWIGVNKAAPAAGALSRCRTWRVTSCRPRRWRWSVSARAP